MPRRKPSSAGAFLTMARAYADAANALMIADASPSPLSSSPIYFGQPCCRVGLQGILDDQ